MCCEGASLAARLRGGSGTPIVPGVHDGVKQHTAETAAGTSVRQRVLLESHVDLDHGTVAA
jgi:hypothetical protein